MYLFLPHKKNPSFIALSLLHTAVVLLRKKVLNTNLNHVCTCSCTPWTSYMNMQPMQAQMLTSTEGPRTWFSALLSENS